MPSTSHSPKTALALFSLFNLLHVQVACISSTSGHNNYLNLSPKLSIYTIIIKFLKQLQNKLLADMLP